MKSTLKVALKANERIYVNGAVISCDRKTCIEFLNDVNFLLENHVLQAAEATTALRQMYFVVQIMLMAPQDTDAAFALYRSQFPALLSTFTHRGVQAELKNIDRLVHERRFYEAMKTIRALFQIEDEILKLDAGARGVEPSRSSSVSSAAAA